MFRINLHNLFESKQLKEELFVNEVFKDKTSELLRNKEPGQEHEHKKPPATAKLNEHNFKVEQTKDIEARDHPTPPHVQDNKATEHNNTRRACTVISWLEKGIGAPACSNTKE